MTAPSKQEQKTVRYYTFSASAGKRRVPESYASSDERAREWASRVALGSPENLTREEGPVAKPTSTLLLWQRTPQPDDLITVYDAAGRKWRVARSALQPE
jgi:hypothetical protein